MVLGEDSGGRGADCWWDGQKSLSLIMQVRGLAAYYFFNTEGRRGFRKESQSVYEQSRLCNKYPN